MRREKKVHVSTDSAEKKSDDFTKFNFKVPTFSPEDPEIWFALLEGQFSNFGIKDDLTKFNYAIANLDIQHAKAIKDIIIKPPSSNRYEKIKSELIKRLSASKEMKVKQLLTYEELGDRTTSQFLRHLRDLAGPDVPEEFIQTIWINRLPKNIQTVLASQTTQTLEQLADLADRIQEITGSRPNVAAATSTFAAGPSSAPSSEIAELRKMVEHLAIKLDEHTRASRSHDRSRIRHRRTPSRSGSRSASNYKRFPVCWYHWKFGTKAHKCQKPCEFKAGNDMGSQ